MPEGQWRRIHGVRGCERGAGNQEDVFWRWSTLNQRPVAAQVVGVEAPASFWTGCGPISQQPGSMAV